MATYYEKESFRQLTDEEIAAEKAAIEWLKKQGVAVQKMRLLSYSSLNRERKTVRIRYDIRILVIVRNIPYDNSPFEELVKKSREGIGSRLWLFPKMGAKGNQCVYCPGYTREEFERFSGVKARRRSKIVWTFSARQCILEVNR